MLYLLQRVDLTLFKKIELLKLKTGESLTSVARIFDMNESSVRKIKKSKGKIRGNVIQSAPAAAYKCFTIQDINYKKLKQL